MKLKKNWVFDSKETISCPPIVFNTNDKSESKVIFVTKKGKVCELNTAGKLNWLFDAQRELSAKDSMFVDEDSFNKITAKPLVFQDLEHDVQRIVFGSENNTIYCLNNVGSLDWSVYTQGPIKASPVFIQPFNYKKGVLACTSYDKNIYLINSTGEVLKKIFVNEQIETSPTVVNNTLVVGTKSGKVIAVNEDGEIIWSFSTRNKISANIVAATLNRKGDVGLIVGSEDNNVYALSTDGELLWSFKTEGAIKSEVVILPFSDNFDREIIFGSCDNTIYCVNQEGELLWSYETEFWVTSSPLVNEHNAGHIIIVGSYDHNVYVLDGAGKYSLDYIPGLSGVINQTTFQSGSLSKEAGQSKGKKMGKYTTESFVIGCASINNSKEIIVSTKKGKIYNLKMV